MNDVKPWYTSVTIIGVYLTALSTALANYPEAAAYFASEEAAESFAFLGQGVGLVMSLWGRYRAKTVIGKKAS